MSEQLSIGQESSQAVFLDTTLSQELTHKSDTDNVFVASLSEVRGRRFISACPVPRRHGLFNEPGRTPQSDLLFITEICRQASIAVCHHYFGVPQGDNFVISDFESTIHVYPRHVMDAEHLTVEVAVDDGGNDNDRRFSCLTAHYHVRSGMRTVFTGRGRWTILPARLYQRLRERARQRLGARAASAIVLEAAAPRCLGRSFTRNVVVGPLKPLHAQEAHRETELDFESHLVVDLQHPTFFDHANDHVPGMLMFEGCIQGALLAANALLQAEPEALQVKRCNIRFSQFAELGQPVVLALRPSPSTRYDKAEANVTVLASQSGNELCAASFGVSRSPNS